MDRRLPFVVIALVLSGAAYLLLNENTAENTAPVVETPQSEVQNVPERSQEPAPTGKSTGVTPRPKKPEIVQPPVVATPAWSLQPFFLKSRPELMHPSKEDWIAIGANGPDQSINLDGWRVRSVVSGNTFVIKTIVSQDAPTIPVRIGSKDVAVFIHTVGMQTQSYAAEGEYHLYFGMPSVAWGKEHDTIQLVNPAGEVADTYSY